MDNQQYGQRQMFQGDWTCSDCGAQITELPFQPDGSRPVSCPDCHRNKRNERSSGGFGGGTRQMFQGDWKCAGCGLEIKELPFNPSGDRPIYCRDCYRNR